MDRLFLIQFIVSFFIGGAFVAFLIFLSERVNEKIAGIIIALPSTSALGLLFISINRSAAVLSEVVPVALIALSITLFYVYVYVQIATLTLKSRFSIFLSILGAFSYWFICVAVFMQFKFHNFFLAFLIFMFSAIGAYYLLNRKEYQQVVAVNYSWKENILRSLGAGLAISLVVLIAKIGGMYWGAAASMFPAVFTFTLILIHKKYGVPMILKIFRKMPIGVFIVMLFMVAFRYIAEWLGVGFGFLLAYTLTIVASYICWKVLTKYNL